MDKFAEIESAAHSGALGVNGYREPSHAQKMAGNYRMGRVTLHGLPISIEQPRNSFREGTDKNGKSWRSRMAAHYGYFRGTRGADGDGVDVFVGPHPESTRVFVINQNSSPGVFDEHKVMLGFDSEQGARDAYRHSYEAGWRGLGSLVPCTLKQFKWWLRHANKSVAMQADQLPQDGSAEMKDQIVWDSTASPVGQSVPALIYEMRREDADGLLLDSVSMTDIMESADEEIALDALVVQNNKLERKLVQLQAIMGMAGGAVKPLAMQITPPFKQRGTVNVAAIFELSDGQTVSIYFHNPDTTPNKILPTDELVSWKWLLNKKDITILVAPEMGKDLNPREVARRIMRLAEKNSTRFAQANKGRADRLANIATLRESVSAKESELKALHAQIDEASAKIEAKKAEPVVVEPTPATVQDVTDIIPIIKPFLSVGQLAAMADGVRGEEGQWFKDKMIELAGVIRSMPKTYDQDGMGDNAVVWLHYFHHAGNWHITEKDAEGDGTLQAFGLADIGMGSPELGYVSIKELVDNGVELDLHWTPKTLAAVRGSEAVPEAGASGDIPPAAAESAVAEVTVPLRPFAVGENIDFYGAIYSIAGYDAEGVPLIRNEVGEEFAARPGETITSVSTGVVFTMPGELPVARREFKPIEPVPEPAAPKDDLHASIIDAYRANVPEGGFTAGLQKTAGRMYDAIMARDAFKLFGILLPSNKVSRAVFESLFNGRVALPSTQRGTRAVVDDFIATLNAKFSEAETAQQSAASGIDLQAQEAAQTSEDTSAAVARQEAMAFLQSVIDGTADMLSTETVERLTSVHDAYADNPEVMEAFGRAADAYSNYMVDKAKSALGS